MDILKRLEDTQEIATLPQVATKILEILQDEDVDVRTLSNAIETDAPLTAKVLKVSNSVIYGLKTPVSSISQAVITIGLNRLANVVMGISIFSHFMLKTNPQVKEVFEKFWWHSASVGVVSKNIAKKLNKNYKEFEFIGGLLHDFGKLLLMQFDFRGYKKVIDMVQSDGISDVEAERTVFGISHLDVGERIAKKWKLPLALANVIGKHSKLSSLNDSEVELGAIIRFADLLCEIWGADFYEGLKVIEFENEESWQIIKKYNPQLEGMDLERLTFELETDFKQSSEFLKIISS